MKTKSNRKIRVGHLSVAMFMLVLSACSSGGGDTPPSPAPAASVTLTVATAGGGTGTVTSNPAGLNCGTTCTLTVSSGTVVTLTAAPAPNTTLTDWGGACPAGTATCAVTVNANQTVTATFNPSSANPSLSVVFAGTGAGSVTCNGGACNATYPWGTSITVAGVPNGNSSFSGWSGGGCTGTAPCTVLLWANTQLTATFNLLPVTAQLSVSKAGNGGGTVTSIPAGINCGATCAANYSGGAVVTLTATSSGGSTFVGWTGGGCTGTGTCVVTLNVNTTVTATFNTVPPIVTLTTTTGGTGTGTVTCNGGACNPSYPSGTALTIVATPAVTSLFAGWSGACAASGTATTCNLMITANSTVSATFNLPTLSVVVAGTGTVTSNPAGINCGATCTASFNRNTAITLTVTGANFSGWSGGGCSGTGSCQVALAQSMIVTATFGPVLSSGRVVYLANQDQDNALELYLAQSGTVTKLNSPAAIPGTVLGGTQFEVMPNWAGVLYAQGTTPPGTLYRTSFSSPGISQQVNHVLQVGGGISIFKISPDSSSVVYTAASSTVDPLGLFRTAFTSLGSSTRLSPQSPQASSRVTVFEFMPDRSGIVYRTGPDLLSTLPTCGLARVNYSSPGLSQEITPPVATCQGITLLGWQMLPDSSGVVVAGNLAPNAEVGFYLIRFLTPGVAQRLDTPGQFLSSWKVLPDSSGIVFLAAPVVNNVPGSTELYRVNFVNPGVQQKVNIAIPTSGPFGGGSVGVFEFTLDGSAVVYTAVQDGVSPRELWRVAFASLGVGQKLTPTIAQGHSGVAACMNVAQVNVCGYPIQMTLDGSGVVFAADITTGKRELYRVNFTTPGTAQLLNPPTAVGRTGIAYGLGGAVFQLASDGTGVIYRADQDSLNVMDLYRVSFSSPAVSTKLSGALVSGRNVVDFRAE